MTQQPPTADELDYLCVDEFLATFVAARALKAALARYEAPVCLAHYDFGRHRRLLDVGGNSGEFALRLCRRHPALRATVLDLPTVCAIGRQHLRRDPEADRITFLPGNAVTDPL